MKKGKIIWWDIDKLERHRVLDNPIHCSRCGWFKTKSSIIWKQEHGHLCTKCRNEIAKSDTKIGTRV